MMKPITLAEIAERLGHKDTEAIRKLWGRTPILCGKQFASSLCPSDIEMSVLLTKLSKKSGQRPDTVSEIAAKVMSELGLTPLEVRDTPNDESPQKEDRSSPSKTLGSAVKTETSAQHAPRNNHADTKPSSGRPPINGHKVGGHAEDQDNNQPRLSASDIWDALPWAVNGVHWFFIVSGGHTLGGLIGGLIGMMVVLLSAYLQMLVRNAADSDTADMALFFTFVVCALSAWLVEYPAVCEAYAAKENRLPISLHWYSGIIAAWVSGSAFVSVWLRYSRAKHKYLTED